MYGAALPDVVLVLQIRYFPSRQAWPVSEVREVPLALSCRRLSHLVDPSIKEVVWHLKNIGDLFLIESRPQEDGYRVRPFARKVWSAPVGRTHLIIQEFEKSFLCEDAQHIRISLNRSLSIERMQLIDPATLMVRAVDRLLGSAHRPSIR